MRLDDDINACRTTREVHAKRRAYVKVIHRLFGKREGRFDILATGLESVVKRPRFTKR